jgi:coenzyme Q-binding protein COQ10
MTTCIESGHLPYTTSQLFDLVADVERYPEFLPWVIEARIRRRTDQALLVDMTIAAGPIRRRFSSTGVLHRPSRIDISSDDPIFDRFEQRWRFESAGDGSNIVYCVDFKLRSRLLQLVMGASFADRAAATVAAFRRRANQLYAP